MPGGVPSTNAKKSFRSTYRNPVSQRMWQRSSLLPFSVRRGQYIYSIVPNLCTAFPWHAIRKIGATDNDQVAPGKSPAVSVHTYCLMHRRQLFQPEHYLRFDNRSEKTR